MIVCARDANVSRARRRSQRVLSRRRSEQVLGARDGQIEAAGVEAQAVGGVEVPGAAARGGVEQDGRGDAHVEALDEAAHRDAHAVRAGAGDLGPDALALVAEDEGDARQIAPGPPGASSPSGWVRDERHPGGRAPRRAADGGARRGRSRRSTSRRRARPSGRRRRGSRGARRRAGAGRRTPRTSGATAAPLWGS